MISLALVVALRRGRARRVAPTWYVPSNEELWVEQNFESEESTSVTHWEEEVIRPPLPKKPALELLSLIHI